MASGALNGRTPLDLGIRFTGAPHRLSVGLRRLDPDGWLLVDDHRSAELALKQELLSARHAEVFAAMPGTDAVGREVLQLVSDEVVRRGLVVHQDGVYVDVSSGLRVGPGPHPLDLAGRLVQEDLCVMEHRDAWRLVAASVCFPSRWSLAQKVGRSIAQIHDPVPGFERIRHATDVAMDRVSADRPVTRSNWTLIDRPELFQPPGEAAGPSADISLRIERQTLRYLPTTGAVLFTIRTVVEPLTSLTPDQAGALATTLQTVDRDTVGYKDWVGVLPRAIDLLSQRAGQ